MISPEYLAELEAQVLSLKEQIHHLQGHNNSLKRQNFYFRQHVEGLELPENVAKHLRSSLSQHELAYLVHFENGATLTVAEFARKLQTTEDHAQELLDKLHATHFLSMKQPEPPPATYKLIPKP